MSARTYALAAAAAVAAGALYVVVHERRRKEKKEALRKLDQPIAKETLVEILQEASVQATEFAAQIGEWVGKMQQEHSLTDERAHQLRQQRFEATLDEVINRIRQKKGVSEKTMDLAFRQYMDDKDVQAVLAAIRRQIAPSLAKPPSPATRVPPNLTKDKLKEIMVFNAVQLERELVPIRKQLAETKRANPQAQVDPDVLVALQTRISDAVRARFGYNDDQVMAAIDKFQAKEDPAFKDVLARITATLNSALAA